MDLRLATLKQSLSICCTMFQHWINAERFPVSHLCVNTLPAGGERTAFVISWVYLEQREPRRTRNSTFKHTFSCIIKCVYLLSEYNNVHTLLQFWEYPYFLPNYNKIHIFSQTQNNLLYFSKNGYFKHAARQFICMALPLIFLKL